MRNYFTSLGLLFGLLVGMCLSLTAQHNHEHPTDHTISRAPLSFIQNKGQWHENVRFKTYVGPSQALYLENQSFTYVMLHPEDLEGAHSIAYKLPHERNDFPIRGHAYKAHFLGSQNSPISGNNKRKEYHNYFIGNDPSKWASRVPLFEEVSYRDLYPGIALKTYSQDGTFKYDLIVEAGSDPSQILIQYDGVDQIELHDGELHIETSVGEMTEGKPYAYQIIGGSKQQVACQYVLQNNRVSFAFPDGYDSETALIIDPTVVGATLSGSSVTNYGHTATFDKADNIYGGCISFGFGYAVTVGAFQTTFGGGTDWGISKYTPDATAQIFATYIGGSTGENPHSMVTDDNQNLYIYGTTSSSNFPTAANAFQSTYGGGTDIVIVKLDSAGAVLLGGTFIGGSLNDGNTQGFGNTNYGDGFRGEIILDDQSNPIIASCSSSPTFPTSAGSYQTANAGGQDAVIFKMTTDLSSMIWSTFLGSPGLDNGLSLREDENGDIYVAGWTANTLFPTTAGVVYPSFQGGLEDGFISKISGDGTTLLASTFWGSNGVDHNYFLDIDRWGNIYVYGQTTGNMPMTPGVYGVANSPQFISSVSPDLATTQFSTTLGDGPNGSFWSADFVPDAFMVDNCDFIYFSGYYATAGLPVTTGALFNTGGFYLGVLDPDAVGLSFATYYTSNHVDGGTSRFSKDGIVYQAVCSSNGSFTATPGAFATGQIGGWDLGVFKIDFESSAIVAEFAASPAATGCAPLTVNFDHTGDPAQIYFWDFDDNGQTSALEDPIYTFNTPGSYSVMHVAIDSSTCNIADTTFLTIIVLPSSTTLSSIDTCQGADILLSSNAINALSYVWQNGNNGSTISADTAGLYYCVAQVNGCTQVDSFVVTHYALPSPTFDATTPVCIAGNGSTLDFTGVNQPNATYIWDFNGGAAVPGSGAGPHQINWGSPGTYNVSLYLDVLGCITDTVTQQIVVTPEPTALFSAPDQICYEQESATVVYNGTAPPGAFFHWEFTGADVITGSGAGPYELEWSTLGPKSICLYVSTSECVSDTICWNVNVTEPPTADFSFDDHCLDDPVDFTNQSSVGGANISNYNWNFGDNNNSATINPTHSYGLPDNYNVSLTVTDAFGCISTVSYPINIWPMPVADFDVDEACEKETFTISSTSTVVSPGVVSQYNWNFGNTTVGDQMSESVRYQDIGTYTIRLEVETQHGCADEISRTIDIHPVPDIDFVFENKCQGEAIVFEDLTTLDTDVFADQMTDWSWSFGDNQSSSTQHPSHLYGEAGTYVVELSVETDHGCIATRTAEVQVFPWPVFELIEDARVCFGDQALLTVVVDSNEWVYWYESSTATESFHQGYTYITQPLAFSETYYVQPFDQTHGCFGERVAITADIFNEVQAEMIITDPEVEIPFALVNFAVGGNTTFTQHQWTFGDGNISQAASPAHEYTYPGIYPVFVDLVDTDGCETRLRGEVEVTFTQTIHAPSAFSPNDDGFNDQYSIGYFNIGDFRIDIYNRWGARVYGSNDPEFEWDGMDTSGIPVPEGVYAFHIQALDLLGREQEVSGTITLMR